MATNKIKELVVSDEIYEGIISEKKFISAIKGCKEVSLSEVQVSKQVQQAVFDEMGNQKDNEEETIISGYFEFKVKNEPKKEDQKLDEVLKRLEQIEKNTISGSQLREIVEEVVNEVVEPRFQEMERDIQNTKANNVFQKS